MKKLLLTSALASSLLVTTAFADVKIGGGLEVTYGDKQTPATSAQKYVGAAIGYEYEIDIMATGQLSNGWKVATHAEFISDGLDTSSGTAPSDLGMRISPSDALTIYIGQDDLEVSDNAVTPKAYALAYDNISNSTAGGSPSSVADSNIIGFAAKIAGGEIRGIYSPDTTQTVSNADKATSSGGGSGYEIGYLGSLGIDGLKTLVALGSKQSAVQSTGDTDITAFGVSYQVGKVAAGFDYNKANDKSSSNADTTIKIYGATYAVNDAVTVGLSRVDYSKPTYANTESTDQLEVAYNLGGLTAAVAYAKTSDKSGAAGSDGDAYTITLKQADRKSVV